MKKDDRVVMLGEDIAKYGGAFKVTAGLFDEFGPTRVIDTPIAESAIVGAAIGAALKGMRPDAPRCSSSTSSPARSTRSSTSRRRAATAGAARADRRARPCRRRRPRRAVPLAESRDVFMHTPGLKVVAPATAYDAKGLIKAAIRDEDPVLFFEHKYLYRRIKEELPDRGLHRPDRQGHAAAPGKDITHRDLGRDALPGVRGGRGARARRHRARGHRPALDHAVRIEEAMDSVKKTSRCIILHEDTLTGGAAASSPRASPRKRSTYLEAPIKRAA